MTGIEVKAETFGLAELGGALHRMAALGLQPRPIWEAIGNYGENSTRLRFARQRDPEGKRWLPSIRAQASGGQTLVQKARLLRSISHRSSSQGTAWGTNVKYAAVHQFGAVIKGKGGGSLRFKMPGGRFVTIKQVTIPARPFLGVNADDGREMLALAALAVYNTARNPSQGYRVPKGGQ